MVWSWSGGRFPFNVKAGGPGPQRSSGRSNSQQKHGGIGARGAAAARSSVWCLSPNGLLDDGEGCHGVSPDAVPS